MSFAFANKLGVSVSKSFNNPYDAFKDQNNKKELCLVSDNRVIMILDTKMISVKWALSCAKRVLHIFEEKYPDDKIPRKAIEAVFNWIKDPSEKNKNICKDATKVAYSYYASFASYASYVVVSDPAYYAIDAINAAYFSTYHASNKSLEIKWQIKKLNQIVYEEILLAFVMTQYIRVDKKLVRKIPKELLEYIASFIIG